MGRRPAALPGVLAILQVIAVQALGLPRDGALSDAARAIADSTAASHRGIAALGVVDAAAPAAAAVLLLSVLVAGAVGSALLAGRGGGEGEGEEEERDWTPTLRIPAAALLGHAGGIGAVLLGCSGAAAYAIACALAAALLLFSCRDRPRTAASPPRPGAMRAAGLLLLGALLFVAAGGADGLLQTLSGARPVPEAWFVVAAEAGPGWLRLPVLGLLAAVAAAAAGMEIASHRRGGAAAWDLAVSAAGWALLLGPSNPCRALALTWSLHCLARVGVPPAARAAFVAALVGGMAGVV